jgi:hypothetical protein
LIIDCTDGTGELERCPGPGELVRTTGEVMRPAIPTLSPGGGETDICEEEQRQG